MTTTQTRTVRDIPLTKLVPSLANVRRTGRDTGIDELAASIAAHGLLQNLTVRSQVGKDGEPTDKFEVIAGGRRLAALKLLAKAKRLAKNAPIPCVVSEDGSAEEISLAENVTQCPMHPADQYEAFAKLHDEQGLGAEDIAARFGVTPAVVRQRMKLGAVSPALMQVYRDGGMSLEQLMAFTLTDDHARQERVWKELGWNKSRDIIRDTLMAEQVHASDRRARFVGAEAYEAAGGPIVRDLFDDEHGGYFADPALLDRLVQAKLEEAAEAVRGDGWRWVEVAPEFDHGRAVTLRRVYPQPKPLTDDEQERLASLESEYENLAVQTENAEDEAEADALQAKLEAVEADIAALTGEEVYDPADVARAGAFVTLSHDGGVRIERGFVKREDETPKAEASPSAQGGGETGDTSTDSGEAEESAGPLPDRLVAELTAYRTAGLREALAQRPDVALIAVVHALALRTFFPHDVERSCLDIQARSPYLTTHAPGIDESAAERSKGERHARWAKQLPRHAEDVWNAVCGMTEDERLALLAHCTASTVSCVRQTERSTTPSEKHAQTLAQAVALDMTALVTPDQYLARVTKARILDAVREGAGDEAATKLVDMKKAAMAEAAAKALSGTGWLPPLLRTAQAA